MNFRWVTRSLFLMMPLSVFADQSFYCPQNHAYINTGMTMEQVVSACGQPLSQQESNEPVLQKVPVQQLVYNNMGTDTAFYDTWNIPTGSGGTPLQVDIVNNKVKNIKMGGSDSNALSICEGANIQIGDDVGKVYNACGNPSLVNNTYINQIVDTAEKPKVWIYQFNPYESPITLTFIDGKLQSIQ